MLQDLVKHHLSSVIITGAVAAISAYVLWGGETKSWKKGRLRPSLENLGNTCFLNCVTQALSSVDSFYDWIKEILLAQHRESEAQHVESVRSEVEILEELRKSAPMITALHEVLTTLQLPTDGSQSTSLGKVHRAMTEHGWDTLFTQEDAYEAFQVLITSIEREAHMLLESETNRQLTAPVQGKFLISLECTECHTESSKKIEPFDNITLHLSRKQNVSLMNLSFNSLRDMLHTYFSPETLSDVECEACSEKLAITTACDFKKQVKIAKAPKCLCIQINRTEYENGSMTKNNQHVSFPIGSMDLTLFAYQALLFDNENEVIEQEPAVSRPVDGYEVVRTYNIKDKSPPMMEGLNYTLKSVIVHHGTANSGHYVTYRRLSNSTWLYASDDVVRLVTRDELERQQIYLLFYERVSMPEILTESASRREVITPVTLPKDDILLSKEDNLSDISQDNVSETMSLEHVPRDNMSPPLILSEPTSPGVMVTPPSFDQDISELDA